MGRKPPDIKRLTLTPKEDPAGAPTFGSSHLATPPQPFKARPEPTHPMGSRRPGVPRRPPASPGVPRRPRLCPTLQPRRSAPPFVAAHQDRQHVGVGAAVVVAQPTKALNDVKRRLDADLAVAHGLATRPPFGRRAQRTRQRLSPSSGSLPPDKSCTPWYSPAAGRNHVPHLRLPMWMSAGALKGPPGLQPCRAPPRPRHPLRRTTA